MSRAWPTLPPLPGPNIPVIDPSTGLMTRDWYRYWIVADPILRGVPLVSSDIDNLTLDDLADIDAPAPTNGQKLTWVTADAKWKGV